MCDLIEELLEETREEMIRKLILSGNFSLEDIAQALEMSLEEIGSIRDKELIEA